MEARRFAERVGFSKNGRHGRLERIAAKTKATLRSLWSRLRLRSWRGDSERRHAVFEGQDSSRSMPCFDQRRERPIDRALDHLTGNAARVHVAAVTDVDADVT